MPGYHHVGPASELHWNYTGALAQLLDGYDVIERDTAQRRSKSSGS
jgi:hypothetical protein